jgi:hypothetical protein
VLNKEELREQQMLELQRKLAAQVARELFQMRG